MNIDQKVTLEQLRKAEAAVLRNFPKCRPAVAEYADLHRNKPCPCGSGKKYKKCCWMGVQWSRAARARAQYREVSRQRQEFEALLQKELAK
jgi:hypothetical protein